MVPFFIIVEPNNQKDIFFNLTISVTSRGEVIIFSTLVFLLIFISKNFFFSLQVFLLEILLFLVDKELDNFGTNKDYSTRFCRGLK